ncbi:MAG TPA: hypothetical protein DDW76_12540 [Cyanobacteria bacterium UBA11369]|nr:hypothetical protein [Cyanobacteria bacterium UBA11369]
MHLRLPITHYPLPITHFPLPRYPISIVLLLTKSDISHRSKLALYPGKGFSSSLTLVRTEITSTWFGSTTTTRGQILIIS